MSRKKKTERMKTVKTMVKVKLITSDRSVGHSDTDKSIRDKQGGKERSTHVDHKILALLTYTFRGK
jgi:hypothetical protein